MNLDINQIALHQLVKSGDSVLDMVLRDSLLPSNNRVVQEMMVELHRVYSAKNKAYGQFNEDSEFANAFKRCRKGNDDFLSFTRRATAGLRDELIKYPFAESGVLLFCQYRHLATEYLLIAFLNSCNSMRVDEQLDLSITHHLDINHVDIVARVDVTKWETNNESKRYLTFLKGRVGRKVSDFFMDFLAASEGGDTKKQNRDLLQAVDDYCAEANLDKEQKQAYRQQVYSYCNEQQQADECIELKQLSEALPVFNEKNLQQFSTEQGYDIADSFPADRPTLRQLTKFSGSGGGLNINFDALLLEKRIFWDAATDTLTIKGTPPNLRDQLKRCLG